MFDAAGMTQMQHSTRLKKINACANAVKKFNASTALLIVI